ncbi:MAG: DUF4115 domain-containing protein [Candidatus Endonucleobacter bathymodioli]|uniref:DUF4115 domain-containing protein n=1 Tax=Candidatus Endonucleibacter bathymodioli TaxID=539814 RepID=A0AA90SDX9_9GAMM|nr:DUF4115 domain-containing protein [Candidatus Endonucleobacter bathymodioli]
MNTERGNDKDCEVRMEQTPWEILTAARIKKGLSVKDIAIYLKTTDAYILALEKGQFEKLPALAYVRGYIRSYAKMMGLDGDQLAISLNACLEAEENPQLLLKQTKRLTLDLGHSSFLIRYSITLGLITIIVSGCYFWWHKNNNVSISDDSQISVDLEASEASEALEVLALDSASHGDQNGEAVSDKNSWESQEVLDVVKVTVDSVDAEMEVLIPAPLQKEVTRLYILFDEDCWVELYDMNDRVLISGLKKAGSELDMEVPSSVRLRLGNAPGVGELKFAGKNVGVSVKGSNSRVADFMLKTSAQG